MTEPTVTPPAPTAPTQEPTQPAATTPPWGAEENFDAQRAWNLIENLRTEKAQLTARALTPEKEQQLTEYSRLVEASKTESQRQQEALAAAQRAAEQSAAEAVRYKAAATHSIPADHFDLLGTGTEEEITARAAKLSTLLAAQAAASATPPAPPAPTRRPVEQLRPGATPSDAKTEDDVVYERLFGAQPK